jgi:hypothetical protein
MISFDKDGPRLALIHYPGGGYGHFIYLLLTKFIFNTIKTTSNEALFSTVGDSHQNQKYTTIYLPPYIDTKNFQKNNHGKKFSYLDYQYSGMFSDQNVAEQYNNNSTALVLCDTGPLVDNHKFLLNYFSQAQMIRVYVDNFIDRLVQISNLMHKAYTATHNRPLYKNSILSFDTLHGLTDEEIIDTLVKTFEQNFNLYGKMFAKPVNNPRIYNFNFRAFSNQEFLKQELINIAEFLGSRSVNLDKLQELYESWKPTQIFHKYYSFTKDTVTDPNDLTGCALVRFLNKNDQI